MFTVRYELLISSTTDKRPFGRYFGRRIAEVLALLTDDYLHLQR